MKRLNLDDVREYVEKNISTFHKKKIASIAQIRLNDVVKRKNPYFFRAKNVIAADEWVRAVVEARVSSSEETMFGDWLEGLAIHVNGLVFGGRKSGISGIDLEFDNAGTRYVVAIKSGPSWGNSSQIAKMRTDFKQAIRTLRTSGSGINVVAVNGCCYGRDQNEDKGDYFKYCGQSFWEFISGEPSLYTDLVEPISYEAKRHTDEFATLYAQAINKLTGEFIKRYCDANGAIDWVEIVRINSGRQPSGKSADTH